MSEGPDWFAPKRYGLGGRPSSWQGWAITLAFAGIVIAVSRYFHQRPLVAAATIVPVLILFMIIVAKTTRGGWRWRWGADD